ALRRRLALVAVCASMLVKVGLELVKPLPMLLLVDHVLTGKPLSPTVAAIVEGLPGTATLHGRLTWCVAATVALFLLTWVARLVNSLAGMHLGQRLVYDLAAELFGHLQRLSLRFHHRKSVGDSLRLVTSDCGCIASIVRDA